MRTSISTCIVLLASMVNHVAGKACHTSTVSSTTPTSTQLALQKYSYCGGNLKLTAYIENLDYDKIVTVYYTNRQNVSTALSAVSLNYNNSISNSNYEIWGTNAPVYVDGITELLNITYQATDIGQTHIQVLNLPVTASGSPAPKLPSLPSPYAKPTGYGNDITKFLAVSNASEAGISLTRMFLNINPDVNGAVKGTVVAAQSGPTYPNTDPNYEYNWVRDSSLTMDVVQMLYSAASQKGIKNAYAKVLFQYATARATEQNDPNLQTGLGEPKFYLNQTIFTGPWGRPQNDGPATAAITLMEFANEYMANGGSKKTVKKMVYDSSNHPKTAPVMKDLLFVARNWSAPSFDLWEEVEGDQFYTRMVQRRALVMGIQFAQKMGDSTTKATLSSALKGLTASLSQFWDPNRKILLYEYGPILNSKSSYLDTAVILGLIHGYANDGLYGYTDDQVLSTAVRIATSFIDVYPIANKTKNSAGAILGIPVGRYPEDVYNGTGSEQNGGNPWYLCTASFAQFMYSAISSYRAAGSIAVTDTSIDFFRYFAPNAKLQAGKSYKSGSAGFKKAISSLEGWGDAFMRTIMYYTPTNGHLTEEINRDNGQPQGAADLTWSYASLLTAAFSRAEAMGTDGYVEGLANMGIV